jgi:superfamily II DNA or RNA helicase
MTAPLHDCVAINAAQMTELRPYQVEAVDSIDRALGERRKVLLVAPTGSGKTEIASAVIKRWVERYKTALFLAHRREIILQASAKLTTNGVPAASLWPVLSRGRWSWCRSRASTRCTFAACDPRRWRCRRPIS